jgi:hypothetical protein
MIDKKDPRKWWLCENERCQHPLGKIVRGDFMDVEAIELMGKSGEQFLAVAHFTTVFCKTCGQKNIIYGDKIGSEEWQGNIRKHIEYDLEDEGWRGEYYDNSFKRNALLKLLTEQEKRTFEFMQKQRDGEWTINDGAKQLGISRDTTIKNIKSIAERIIKLEARWQKEERELIQNELEEMKKKLESRKGY